MKQITIPNTDLKASQICYGVMRFGAKVHGEAMFDLYKTYLDAGGNFFDTAHSYACWYPNGDGCSERSLGECLKKFGRRDEMVVMTKGALPGQGNFYKRPADCMTPAVIGSDITDSLERLKIDAIDIYMLHRDDTTHTVEEIIDTLNDEVKKGRIRYMGASNWTAQRLADANAYAKSKGLKGFVANSPQWNLGRANHNPINWDGSFDQTAHIMDDEDIAFHRKTQMANTPWTPTAYGYFDGATGRNPESFDNPTSRSRKNRAEQLAKELGVSTNQVAMAYLLAFDFPVFPIVGTTNPDHLKDSLDATKFDLTAKQRDWLVNG